MTLAIESIQSADDREWGARLMAGHAPWTTLRRDLAACDAVLRNPAKERYVVREGSARVGVLILDMHGPFPGYIQSIGLAPEARGRGIGSRVIEWAEARIFRDSPNVFICVSSFNPDAERLYRRLGYELIGTLRAFVVDEHDELLLRKTRGSWESFRARSVG
jgi:ribosomal protein S18 acetylase RimI-like enzyme